MTSRPGCASRTRWCTIATTIATCGSYIEAGDEEERFEDRRSNRSIDDSALPPRHYPEWDEATRGYRPDWVSVYDTLQPAGDPADIDTLLGRHAPVAKHLKRVLDLIKPQDRTRLRYQEEGTELDLDVAVRAITDWRAGAQPDPRIHMSTRTDGRDIAVLLLVDLSASVNDAVAGTDETVLSVSRAAVALLAWAISQLGDQLAIAGFHSNTRHEVRYLHIKGFAESWDDTPKARLAATLGAYSTRMGAALRHAGHLLSGRRADKKLLLVLTDGQPADVDVSDPQHLQADAALRRARTRCHGPAYALHQSRRKGRRLRRTHLRHSLDRDRPRRAIAAPAARAVPVAHAMMRIDECCSPSWRARHEPARAMSLRKCATSSSASVRHQQAPACTGKYSLVLERDRPCGPGGPEALGTLCVGRFP